MPFHLLVEPEGNGQDNLKSFCWREGLISRYESLWSLLHKFALLNFVGAKDLWEVFALESNKDNFPLRKRNRRDDLRGFWGLDASKLSRIITDEKQLNESVATMFVNQNELLFLTSETLRFCKKCLETGFHSSLYQFLFLNRCPYHEEDFLTKCSNCEKRIDYKLGSHAFKNPYSCPHCEFCFCPSLTNIDCHLSSTNGRDEALSLIGDWLIKRMKSEVIESKLTTKRGNQFSGENFNLEVSELTAYWSDIYVSSSEYKLKDFLAKQSSRSLSIYRITQNFNAFKEENTNDDYIDNSRTRLDKDLFKIYKSIGRHFLRKNLAGHKKCIFYFCQKIYWDKNTVACRGRICELANAYILWRMYFEGANQPFKLLSGFKRNFYRVSQWLLRGYNCPNEALKRIFAFKCFWIFYECQSLAHQNYLGGTYSFLTVDNNQSFVPHWIIKVNSCGKRMENFNFYYWVERTELSNLMILIKDLQKFKCKIIIEFELD